ncbi:MAG TPA: phosphate ABC transporter substrate-binding protein PstS [Rhodopila sp.]|uniref:phosphate ABC transporter substrate-binding protein PstS n=1 Tax=Rhodopila sp. TaxID=2480087 RepID=UPI002C5B2D02|nr:phosphate ABC transporter substrate-binding protein PstS [Rhodopila sp.]HVY14508.1 phosphate ABC transporter substrate-binding protein PstS [Rhodopila sp.]
MRSAAEMRNLLRCLPVLGILACTPAMAADLVLNETGSTLLYPLFQQWVPAYAALRPEVKINAAGTNSGAGIAAAIDGSVQIGTSDAYMSDEDAERNKQIISVPLAISAQTVNYNLPGLNAKPLKLDGPTIAAIYAGRVRQWDDPAIAALNPGTALPHDAIVPVRRGDASGDTFVFTQFLDFSTQRWEDAIGYGTTVKWPSVDGEKQANGNKGMVDTIAATPYSIGYVGISFRPTIEEARLGTALLKNQSGRFVTPTPETISAGASVLDPRTPPDERLSLVYAPGERSYPLVNYEYAMVSLHQPDAAKAAALRNFLLWAIAVDGGNATKFLDAVGFIPLPDFIRAMSEKQVNRIR